MKSPAIDHRRRERSCACECGSLEQLTPRQRISLLIHDLLIELELNPESQLALTSRQNLRRCTEKRVVQIIDGSRILTIQEIEEFEQDMQLDPLSKVETFSKAHVKVNEGRGSEGIPAGAGSVIDSIKGPVTVGILRDSGSATKVEPTLRPEDAADLNLPGQVDQPVDLKDMLER